MSKNTILLLAIFLLPLIAYFYVSHSSESNATVSTSSGPQIIKFTSDMCGECKRMDAVIKKVYPKYQNKIQLVQIAVQNNTEYNNDMIAKYKVTLVPTTVLLKKDKKIYKRIEGYI
ncbi:MAG: thioredoxin family protein, partial [Candidatus Gastranaerophilales bacterium]|nr:thioredoxin family protein [Candidatus Gastranaerophilales bacterium]